MSQSEIWQIWAGTVFCDLRSFFEVSEFCIPCLPSDCLPQETLKLRPAGLEADCALRLSGSGTPRRIRARSKTPKSLLLGAFICDMGKLGLEVPSLPDLDQRFELGKNINRSW